MAVITSDSDLYFLLLIRLIGSTTSCMQFDCRDCLLVPYTETRLVLIHKPLQISEVAGNPR